MQTQNKVFWTASLSDGHTHYEGKNEYQEIKGELSPWLRLIQHIENKGLEITSLSLYMNTGERWNLPSAGTNPKFKMIDRAVNPVGYRFFRVLKKEIPEGKEERYNIIEAIFSNYKLQVWVSLDGKTSWSVVV